MPLSGNLAYRLYQTVWTGLDWLYPPVCAGCNQSGARWCASCQQSVQRVSSMVCPCCGQVQTTANLCSRCQSEPPQYAALRSWAVFSGKIRDAQHRLKYRRDIALGEVLARPLIEYLKQLNWSIDLILPVPLSAARMAERGYNQAALLARPIGLALGLKYRSQALSRARETRSQVGLSHALRKENVKGAFVAHRELVNGQSVLIVDDVVTTGSTLDACATALVAAGARSVYGLTLARAILHTTDSL